MRHDLIGQKFGRLTVIAEGARTANKKITWICRCDCGNVKKKPVVGYDLKSGKVQSCGCLYLESNKGRNEKHGKTGIRLHRIWLSMRQRCGYSSGGAFKNYGGRGVTICKEWDDFQVFHDWAVLNGYSDNLTLDRKDNDKGYSPENCRWITMKEQQNNRRNNRIVEYCGEKYTLSELAQKLNIRPATLGWRIDHGWKEEEFGLLPNLNNKNIRGNIA